MRMQGARMGREEGADSEAYNERVSVEYTCRVPSSRSGVYQSPAATAAEGVPLLGVQAVPPMELGTAESRPGARASTDCTTTADGATEWWLSAAVVTTNAHGDADAAVAPFSCDSVTDLKWSTQRRPLQKGFSGAHAKVTGAASMATRQSFSLFISCNVR